MRLRDEIHAKRGIKQTNVVLLALTCETAAPLAVGRKQIIFNPFHGHDLDLGPVLDLLFPLA